MALVDRALGVASTRELYVRDEACLLLDEIRASVRDEERAVKVRGVVDDAVISYRQDRILDRSAWWTRSSTSAWPSRKLCRPAARVTPLGVELRIRGR
jgi:hypothetical protein